MVLKLFKNSFNFVRNLKTYSVGLLQAKAYRILNSTTNKSLKKFDISSFDWAVLGLLSEHPGGMSLKSIADEVGVKAPLVTVMTERLLRKNMVNIEPGDDKRSKILKLTKMAEQAIPEIEKQLRSDMKKLLLGITIRDVLGYYRVLQKITENNPAQKK